MFNRYLNVRHRLRARALRGPSPGQSSPSTPPCSYYLKPLLLWPALTRDPVTVNSCSVPVTFAKAPARAVSNDINTTEDMLALGLEPDMVGDFGVEGDGPVGQPVPSPYLAGFHKVRDVSSNYFTLEETGRASPRLFVRGLELRASGGDEPDAGKPGQVRHPDPRPGQSHAPMCSPARKTVSIDNTYQDLSNLGQISGSSHRAQQVISSMQHQVSVRAEESSRAQAY